MARLTKAEDHVKAIKYLQNVPTSHGISLGIFQGVAGSGKTYFAAETIVAKLRDDPTHKTLVLTPSNDATDVFARKVAEIAKKHPNTRDSSTQLKFRE
jgi:hypothetical protein